MTPKPKGSFRALQVSSMPMGTFAGFVVVITKPLTTLSNGPHQLSGQGSGIDAVVILEQTGHGDPLLHRAKHDAWKHNTTLITRSCSRRPSPMPLTAPDQHMRPLQGHQPSASSRTTTAPSGSTLAAASARASSSPPRWRTMSWPSWLLTHSPT